MFDDPVEEKNNSQGALGRRIASSLEEITLEKIKEAGFANALANATHIANGRNIAALRDSFLIEGSDALIIAAGPSIHRYETAKIIKESGFDGVIIATESAMSWCLRHGILPHLVVTLDPHASRIVRWFGDPGLTETKLMQDDYFSRQDMDPKFRVDQLRFNDELVRLINKHGSDIQIAIASSASPAVVNRVTEARMSTYWWNPMYDDYEDEDSLTVKIHALNGLPCINAGGNVGSACWVIAQSVLRKKRIGLVGMDLGYYSDTPYNQTQYYKEIVELVGTDRLDDVFIHILNPYLGCKFYTDPAYLWYRDSFLEMTRQARCTTVNCTGGGVLFGEGIEWLPLQEFLSSSTTSRV